MLMEQFKARDKVLAEQEYFLKHQKYMMGEGYRDEEQAIVDGVL